MDTLTPGMGRGSEGLFGREVMMDRELKKKLDALEESDLIAAGYTRLSPPCTPPAVEDESNTLRSRIIAAWIL
jgi:hypothetical protein